MGKKNEKWLRVGNFLLGVERNRIGRFVVCKSASGLWSVRWREDSLMFHAMLNVMTAAADNDGAREYLHSLVSMMFMATCYTHDLVSLSTRQQMPFCEGFAMLLKEQNDYELSLRGEVPAEADKAALDEVVRMREVEEELEALDDGLHG